jgi:hypothetical protein
MRRVLVSSIAVAILAACSLGQEPPALRGSSEVQTSFGYRDLVGLVPSMHSVDDLLDKLASSYPRSIESFSLVFASRSLQAASPEFPRVIAFGEGFDLNSGKNNQLVMAFSGDPARPGYDTLEVMSVADGDPTIRLAEVRFPPNGTGAPVVEENPAKCATCHGSPARPIWDTYPVWPGVYGANEDQPDARLGELASFKVAAAKFGKPGRYRRLRLRVSHDGVTFQTAPNQELGMSLSVLEANQIAARLRSLPTFPTLKYAVLGAAAGCLEHGSDGWFSNTASAALGLTVDQVRGVTMQDIAANRAAKVKRFFNLGGQAVPSGDPNLRSIDEEQQVTGIRFVSLLMGENMRRWSPTLGPRAFSFATRGIDNLFFALYYPMKNDPVVKQAAFRNDGEWLDPQVDCNVLASANKALVDDAVAQSIGAGAPATLADLASDGLDKQEPIVRCAACHTDPWIGPDGTVVAPATEGAAPYFPFYEPEALGKLLAANDGALLRKMTAAVTAAEDAPQRMPKRPARPLTQAEQAAFTDFVRSIAAAAGAH